MMQFKGLVLQPARAQRSLQAAQSAVDAAVIQAVKPYTPVASKRFKNAGKMRDAHKAESPGTIVNEEPKARREYYENRGGSGGLRGKLWFERMKADHKAEILRKGQEAL